MLDRTKLSTHQYAKSQIKWIRKQLIPAAAEARRLGGEVALYVVRGGPQDEELAKEIMQGEYTRGLELTQSLPRGPRPAESTECRPPRGRKSPEPAIRRDSSGRRYRCVSGLKSLGRRLT
jgi:hypothetical protein